jgi:hypothetical protein
LSFDHDPTRATIEVALAPCGMGAFAEWLKAAPMYACNDNLPLNGWQKAKFLLTVRARYQLTEYNGCVDTTGARLRSSVRAHQRRRARQNGNSKSAKLADAREARKNNGRSAHQSVVYLAGATFAPLVMRCCGCFQARTTSALPFAQLAAAASYLDEDPEASCWHYRLVSSLQRLKTLSSFHPSRTGNPS